ncbi:hypothetical protein H6504_00360 [Candidatus Woesearchaeota archaeon]|nr:hypothetical protein [Candidatus Woesearchaeota archaeon]
MNPQVISDIIQKTHRLFVEQPSQIDFEPSKSLNRLTQHIEDLDVVTRDVMSVLMQPRFTEYDIRIIYGGFFVPQVLYHDLTAPKAEKRIRKKQLDHDLRFINYMSKMCALKGRSSMTLGTLVAGNDQKEWFDIAHDSFVDGIELTLANRKTFPQLDRVYADHVFHLGKVFERYERYGIDPKGLEHAVEYYSIAEAILPEHVGSARVDAELRLMYKN